MMRRVSIEPIGAEWAIRVCGHEQLWAKPRATVYFHPTWELLRFQTIDQARDFCTLCQFTWSVRAT